MQTLGLSDSTPRSDSRIKSLFWPSIQTGTDVDYLGAQGYWVCTIVAIASFIFLAATGHLLAAAVVLVFYYVGGIGVRERNFYAAVVVFSLFALDTIVAGFGVVRVLLGALLLSNVRGTWIASQWRPESEEASLPPRLSDTWSDKFADAFPPLIWPKVRIAYYIFSGLVLFFVGLGLTGAMLQHLR